MTRRRPASARRKPAINRLNDLLGDLHLDGADAVERELARLAVVELDPDGVDGLSVDLEPLAGLRLGEIGALHLVAGVGMGGAHDVAGLELAHATRVSMATRRPVRAESTAAWHMASERMLSWHSPAGVVPAPRRVRRLAVHRERVGARDRP